MAPTTEIPSIRQGANALGHTVRALGPFTRRALCLAAVITGLSFTPAAAARALPQGHAVVSQAPLELRQFKMMNYYPSDAAWTNMWTHWNPATLATDFAEIAGMGANVVRLIVAPSAFGFPLPDATMLSRLATAVALARDNGLRVDLTLFDWWSDYSNIAGSDTWLAHILSPYRSNAELAFIELQNEPNVAEPAVTHWVRSVFPFLRQCAGSVPTTVSVRLSPRLSQLKALQAALTEDPPSFYDVHTYAPPGVAYAELARAKATVAPIPLYVGETGISTEPSPGSNQALAYAEQSWYYRAVEWDVQQLGLPPAAPWTFTDFTSGAVPVAARTQMRPSQHNYGLFTTANIPKPAASVISNLFQTGTIDPTFNQNFNEGSHGMPAVWHPWCSTPGEISWSATVGDHDPGAVRLRGTGGTPSCWPSVHVEPVNGVASPNETFNATVEARGIAATGNNIIQIAWFDANGTYLGNSSSASLPTGTTPWTQLSVSSTAPAGAVYAQIYLASSHNRGVVWFDDVTWHAMGT